MLPTVLLLAASAGVGLAETMEFLYPYADPQPLVASSIDSDASATTWLVGCPAVSDASVDCGIPYAFTVTSGPRTVHYSQSFGETYSMDLACVLEAKTSAFCTISVDGYTISGTDYQSGTSTADSVTGDLATLFMTASVVTDAASILNPGGMPAVATGTADNTKENTRTTSSISRTATTPMVVSTPTVTSAPTIVDIDDASATTTPSTASSTAGMPQITGNSRWAMGGMAAAMALAAL